MTQLYLIRHGQAHTQFDGRDRGSLGHILVGGMRGDAGLTPLGREQAQRLRDRLAATGEIHADAAYASTLPRAWQTAEIVAPALGVPVLPDDDLHELRPGEADGLTLAEAELRYGVPDFRWDPFRPISPGGETWPQFTQRVAATLDRIVRAHPERTVVLFTHGGFVDATFLVNFRLHTLIYPPMSFSTYNTAITHWERRLRDGQPEWRLVRYNDDLHARDVGTRERIGWVPLAPRQAEAPSVPLPEAPAGKAAEGEAP